MQAWIMLWWSPPRWGRAFRTSYAVFALFELWVWTRDRRAASGKDAALGRHFGEAHANYRRRRKALIPFIW